MPSVWPKDSEGFPIGAIWSQSLMQNFFSLAHTVTFGGSPLASAAANATLDIIEEEKLIENVAANSPQWHAELQKVAEKYPELIMAYGVLATWWGSRSNRMSQS